MIVYKITNIITGKSYVGRTIKSLEERWNRHCTNTSACMKLHSSIKKHGQQNFVIEVLKHCKSVEETCLIEIEMIKLHKTLSPYGYNLTSGGEGGGTPSQETRDKLSKALRGKIYGPISENHRQKLSQAKQGTLGNHRKPVKCSNGKTYLSAHDAAKDLNLYQANICKVLKGLRKKTGGYSFGYIET